MALLEIQRLPAGKAVLDFVPPSQIVLAEFPAKIDDSSLQFVREIDEPGDDVLYDDSGFSNRFVRDRKGRRVLEVGGAEGRTPSELGSSASPVYVPGEPDEHRAMAPHLFEQLAKAGNHRPRLGDGERLLVHAGAL